MGKEFKKEDLKLCEWQYAIKHNNKNCFKSGEIVFLKSNPKQPMIVNSINDNTITTAWYSLVKGIEVYDFPFECVLQYKYAGLLIYRQKFCMSLN